MKAPDAFFLMVLAGALAAASGLAQEATDPEEFPLTSPPSVETFLPSDAGTATSEGGREEEAPQETMGGGKEDSGLIRELQEEFDRDLPPAGSPAGATAAGNGAANPVETAPVLRAVAWLFVICSMIVLLGYFARRFGKRTPLLSGQRYGEVLGRLHLTPRVAVHFVKSGGRVLLIGVSQQAIACLAEFEAESFEALADPADHEESSPQGKESFLARLQASEEALNQSAGPVDDELESLRGDIQRLQASLQERARETPL